MPFKIKQPNVNSNVKLILSLDYLLLDLTFEYTFAKKLEINKK